MAINSGIDPGIGGDVAVLVFEQHKPARWFSQPIGCKG
jgi:hypothetical protein